MFLLLEAQETASSVFDYIDISDLAKKAGVIGVTANWLSQPGPASQAGGHSSLNSMVEKRGFLRETQGLVDAE